MTTVAARATSHWHRVRERASDAPPLRVSAWATLVTVVPFSPGYAFIPVLLLAAAGFSWSHLLERAWFWFALAGVRLVALVPVEWPMLDNHHYLLTYWLLALGFAHLGPAPSRTAALASRLLIGLAFALATLWKVIAPDFPTGEFFRYLLATDGLPTSIGSWLPGGDPVLVEANEEAAAAAVADGPAVTLAEAPLGPVIGRGLAWWTLAIEAAVAIAFLAPAGRRLVSTRIAVLLLFIVTTYPIAPVIAFGWTLVAMALALVPEGDHRWLLALLGSAAIVLAAAIPHLGPGALALLGVLLILRYLRTLRRWWMSIGAPLTGCGVGLILGEPWHLAAGMAVGLLVDTLFALVRRRQWRPTVLASLLVGAVAAVAWERPGLVVVSWAAVALGAGVSLWVAAVVAPRDAEPAFSAPGRPEERSRE